MIFFFVKSGGKDVSEKILNPYMIGLISSYDIFLPNIAMLVTGTTVVYMFTETWAWLQIRTLFDPKLH